MKLFKILPLGLGSSVVESLPSFFIRLASVHALSPNELRSLILNRYAGDAGCKDEMVRPQYAIPSLSQLVRPTEFTGKFVADLQSVGDFGELSTTTLLALGKRFGRQRGVFRDNLSWCPECFREQLASGQNAHLYLLWGFRDYGICHLHGCQILQRCPTCDSKQNSLKMRGELHICVQCGDNLASVGAIPPGSGQEGVYVKDLVDLASGISAEPGRVLSQESARKCVDMLFDEVWRREEEKQLWEMIPRDECISIVCGDKDLTLPVLRRIAYRLGVSLYQLLCGRLEPVTRALNPSWLMELPTNLQPRPKRRRICREKFLKRLITARDKFQEPPPLSSVAKAAGTSTGAIEHHFPAFATEIKSKYRKMKDADRQRREEMARTLVFEFLAGSQKMSRKSAQRYVASRSNLPKNLVRRLVSKHVPAAGSIKSAQY